MSETLIRIILHASQHHKMFFKVNYNCKQIIKDVKFMGLGIVYWIVIGALAGWIASMIVGKNSEMGAGANIVVGIIGGFIGGLVMNMLGGQGITGFNLWSLLVATLGSVIFIWLVNLTQKAKHA